ncbi:protein transport protein Sec31A isoform X2 [Coccinella septempunctata]|uniref:protein transport protein Sec31A isoform X2 n=1 Tax=Coccinella septempunctata TaxID=41139 RepID=UPI001D087802|nr:protein transport protein Sec31A isoform X2 [Coccinella septempunctata]
MKVKDLERTANVAWSPKNCNPIYLAAGTAAQQLDASFNTNAALEIYSLNLTEPGLDLKQHCSVPSEHRFHKLIWGATSAAQGTIIGGCDSGIIKIYNATKLLNNENGLVMQQDKHNGPVHSLDFNPFQHNLFATGASDSEIFIWDMNNLQTPMSPGSKPQPFEDVLSLSWNRQVQHILASTFASKCVIWDLRKNEPIIKLTDTVSRIRWKVVAWHPEVATQLCLASEEDHSPVVQIWDLRFATSPLKTLENHERGVLSVAWCSDDPDLLVSCGKDNRILCWNPSSSQPNGEVLSEIAKTNQWNFDVVWCPKNPAIIACPNFDGHVSVYSLLGGKTQQFQTSDKIADSFPGMDGYAKAPVQTQNVGPVSVDLPKPPKWMRKPVGASFAFGGKLISFENEKPSTQIQSNQNGNVSPPSRTVHISQIVTEEDLVKDSVVMEEILELGNFAEYCRDKAEHAEDQHKKYIWNFIRAQFDENPRAEILNLLGYKIEDVNNHLNEIVGRNLNNEKDLCNDFSNMNRIEDFDSINDDQSNKKPVQPFKIHVGNDTEGLITQALLLGNVEAAVELCLKAKRYTDAIIIAMSGGSDLLARTQQKYLEQSEGYISSLISALVTDNWRSIIENCDITSWKEALSAALTHASDEDLPQLCENLGFRLEKEAKDQELVNNAHLCYISSGSLEKLVNSWNGNVNTSTKDLKELVELVILLEKAMERQGRQVSLQGPVSDLLSNYALILVSQGCSKEALTYLGSSKSEKLNELRDRLLVHLGQKPAYGQPVRQQSRHSVGRQSFTNYPSYGTTNQFNQPNNQFGNVVPNQFGTTASNQFGGPPPSNQFGVPAPNQFGVPAPNQFVAPLPNQFGMTAPSYAGTQNLVNQGIDNDSSKSQPWQNPGMPPVPKSLTPTSKPPSIKNSSTNATGLPQRKYILDPSVTSNQYNSALTRNPTLPNQPMGNFNSPQQTYNSPSMYTSPLPMAPQNFNPSPLVSAPQTGYGTNFNTAPPLSPSQTPVAQEALETNNMSAPVASGWNDPPTLYRSLKNQMNKDMSPRHSGTRLWSKTAEVHFWFSREKLGSCTKRVHPELEVV